jgi:hypothetical protein
MYEYCVSDMEKADVLYLVEDGAVEFDGDIGRKWNCPGTMFALFDIDIPAELVARLP